MIFILAHNRLDALRHGDGVYLTRKDQLRGHNSTNARLVMTDNAYLHPRFAELLAEARRRNLRPNEPYPDTDLHPAHPPVSMGRRRTD